MLGGPDTLTGDAARRIDIPTWPTGLGAGDRDGDGAREEKVLRRQ